MGWFTQGCLRKYDYTYSPPKYLQSEWVTGNNGCENAIINNFSNRVIDIDASLELEVRYGPSDSMFFYGYAITHDERYLKHILKSLDGLLVYKEKHGPTSKAFKAKNVIIINISEAILFYERKNIWTDQEWKTLKEAFIYWLNEKGIEFNPSFWENLYPNYW